MDMKKDLKRIALLATAVLFGAGLFAQQDPHFTMYMFNKQVINPGYAGSKGPYLQGLYRNQWVGIDGAPETVNAGFHSPVGKTGRVALGLFGINDRIGVDQHTGIYGQYAYRIPLDDDAMMSIGLQAGVTRYEAKLTELIQPLWAYPGGDPAVLGADLASSWLPNVGAGVYIWGQRFYIGASLPHLINNRYDPDREVNGFTEIARQYRHAFGMAGIIFPVSDKFAFQPQIMAKYVFGTTADGGTIQVPFDADFDLGMIFNDIVMFGLAYRLSDSFDAYIKAQLTRNLELGYAYDYTTSKLNDYTSGSHEIMLGWKFAEKVQTFRGPRQWTF